MEQYRKLIPCNACFESTRCYHFSTSMPGFCWIIKAASEKKLFLVQWYQHECVEYVAVICIWNSHMCSLYVNTNGWLLTREKCGLGAMQTVYSHVTCHSIHGAWHLFSTLIVLVIGVLNMVIQLFYCSCRSGMGTRLHWRVSRHHDSSSTAVAIHLVLSGCHYSQTSRLHHLIKCALS